MLKIAIVENESRPAETLRAFAERWSAENNIECKTAVFKSGVDFIEEYRPDYDAVFLDIMMPLLDGMSTAEKLRETDAEVPIIFVTNMAQFAIRGYKVGALDFIVKPINYFDFTLEMKKILKINAAKEDKYLYAVCGGVMRRIAQSQISFIEIVNHNVVVHTDTETLSWRGTLKDVEAKLDNRAFSRCNNCYIVNLKYVAEIDGDTVTLEDGARIAVSRPRKSQFMNELNEYIARRTRGGDV